ncbi:MAG TPA: NmrA/HSCARG family protein, partial [Myxococcales bacterium]|nr:NmrA/HSCARG family protein [Myxococcales bacterium]
MSAGAPKKLIAVVGASGAQGGGVIRALQARSVFAVRALTRRPRDFRLDGGEVVEADLTRPDSLARAFQGAYGAFVVTNFWEKSAVPEQTQARNAIRAARDAGVQHLVWSTLPDVDAISGGAFHVPHFTGKAEVDADVKAAGFPAYTFVEAPFYFQNLSTVFAPEPQPGGGKAWVLPLDPNARCLHIGDVADLGKVVAGAFERPETAGRGQHLAIASALMS